jgi:hypothetical protein
MDKTAITKARDRLRVAKSAVECLEKCTNYQSFCDNWYVFLVSTKNIYTTMEQGAKTSPQSRQWYGGKKTIRRNDELLQYIFQARDDAEHGLTHVTEHVPGSLAIGVAKAGYSNATTINGTIGEGGTLRIHSNDGKPVLIEQILPHARLATVHGRGNIPYRPPTMHLNKPLESNLPLPVAKLSISYFETLISEADGLA